MFILTYPYGVLKRVANNKVGAFSFFTALGFWDFLYVTSDGLARGVHENFHLWRSENRLADDMGQVAAVQLLLLSTWLSVFALWYCLGASCLNCVRTNRHDRQQFDDDQLQHLIGINQLVSGQAEEDKHAEERIALNEDLEVLNKGGDLSRYGAKFGLEKAVGMHKKKGLKSAKMARKAKLEKEMKTMDTDSDKYSAKYAEWQRLSNTVHPLSDLSKELGAMLIAKQKIEVRLREIAPVQEEFIPKSQTKMALRTADFSFVKSQVSMKDVLLAQVHVLGASRLFYANVLTSALLQWEHLRSGMGRPGEELGRAYASLLVIPVVLACAIILNDMHEVLGRGVGERCCCPSFVSRCFLPAPPKEDSFEDLELQGWGKGDMAYQPPNPQSGRG